MPDATAVTVIVVPDMDAVNVAGTGALLAMAETVTAGAVVRITQLSPALAVLVRTL